ncbi:hypothetical protein KC19_VG181000 [Ceratodon purpureus]|uniref:Uncharacterized protein n=1 Tax=Ceratodon purpureus TaxID=3225 RepID=A0A8T0HSE3_CERPU|nr:hypothetical protein KC19_VG181000 [Ceratodon purpureus]
MGCWVLNSLCCLVGRNPEFLIHKWNGNRQDTCPKFQDKQVILEGAAIELITFPDGENLPVFVRQVLIGVHGGEMADTGVVDVGFVEVCRNSELCSDTESGIWARSKNSIELCVFQ